MQPEAVKGWLSKATELVIIGDICISPDIDIIYTYGSVSKPCTPGEHQNRWQMDVHPLINCIYSYRSMAIYVLDRWMDG